MHGPEPRAPVSPKSVRPVRPFTAMSRALPRAVFAAATTLFASPALAQDTAALQALIVQSEGAPATPAAAAASGEAAKPGEPPKAPPVLDTLKKAA